LRSEPAQSSGFRQYRSSNAVTSGLAGGIVQCRFGSPRVNSQRLRMVAP
jgi:hypothetical protein